MSRPWDSFGLIRSSTYAVLGGPVAAPDPVPNRRCIVFRPVLPDEVAAVEQHGARSGQGPVKHIGIFRGHDRIMCAPDTQNRGVNTGEKGAQASEGRSDRRARMSLPR
jgi:hypothetical protein